MSTDLMKTFDRTGISIDAGVGERAALARARRDLERKLDRALEETFPASDPVSILVK